MNKPNTEHTKLLRQLRHALSEIEYPDNYQLCMEAASELVEEAAISITNKIPGNRVAELLLLASRLEEFALSPDGTSNND